MKNLFRIIIPAAIMLMLSLTAHAYNVVDLPESMALSEAMGIFSADEITNITVSDIADGRYIALDEDGKRNFYNTVKDLTVRRYINATPFRGIAVNIYRGDTAITYSLDAGLQVGLYGNGNYICYKLSDVDTEKILYLEDAYWDDEVKAGGETIHRDTSKDFLKLPEAPWARTFVQEAAAKCLLPYEFTSGYSNSITREQFCILLGNLITVRENYASLEDYMIEKGGAYLRNYFVDCGGADDSINILHALGIVNGKDDNRFDPYGTITREEAAALLCRVAERYRWIGTFTSLNYEDSWSISEWARFFVTWATENGIMSGVSGTEFDPHGAYTVEQAIATIVRLYNLIN